MARRAIRIWPRDPDLAYRINGLGTQAVALAAARHGAVVAYVSSNEVFDGQAGRPYTEFDSVRAINPYGASKLAGEWFIQHLLQRFYIMRTSWVTGRGGRNFVHRIQQLADERGSLRVVNDEVANPTFVDDLADAITRLIITDRYGIYHLTNSGHVSRYDYARRILALSGRAHPRALGSRAHPGRADHAGRVQARLDATALCAARQPYGCRAWHRLAALGRSAAGFPGVAYLT